MTLADNLKPRIERIRGIPASKGIRPNTVSVVRRTWDSGVTGRGTPTDSTLTLSPTPKVREVSTREVATSGGAIEQGDLVIGHITPAYAGPPAGGYTPAQLAPRVAPDERGVEILYVVTGPSGGEYALVTLNGDRALHYTLTVRRTNVGQ